MQERGERKNREEELLREWEKGRRKEKERGEGATRCGARTLSAYS